MCCSASSKAVFLNLGPIDISIQIILGCGACPVLCRGFSSVPGLYLLDAHIAAPQL